MLWNRMPDNFCDQDKLFVFVHSETLPLSKRIKEVLEEKLQKGKIPVPAVLVDWHREREIALRFTSYPPRMVLLQKGCKIAHLDDVSPMEVEKALEQETEGDTISEELPPSWKVLTEVVLGEFRKNLLFLYDPYTAGFGASPRFVEVEALEVALCFWIMERDIRFRMIVEDTISVLLHSPMFKENKLYTFSYSTDWSEPSSEITLELQSCFVRLLLYSAKSIPWEGYTKLAEKMLEEALKLTPENPGAQYSLSRSLLLMCQLKRDEKLLDKGLELLDEASPSTYLGFQAEKGLALLEAYFTTSEERWLNKAVNTCEEIVEKFYDGRALKDSLLSIPTRYGTLENAKACELLLKIHYLTDNDTFKETALRCLENISKKGVDEGVKGVYLTIPITLALNGPMTVKMYGKDPLLQRAAFSLMNPLRIIQYMPSEKPKADLCFNNICFPETSDPNQLRDHIVSLLISGKA